MNEPGKPNSMEKQKRIEQIASETLSTLANTADEAVRQLGGSILSIDGLAGINTLTSSQVSNSIAHINEANQSSLRHLKTEPAISRVVVEDENSNRKTYYFCRCDQGLPNLGVISRNAYLGRLASLDIGDEFSLPNGAKVHLLEKAKLVTVNNDGWDAINTIVDTELFGPLTIESLRAVLTANFGGVATEDILAQLLAEDSEQANIFEGIRRNVITKMGLRDQPILDKYQDEIFRLPLDKRLLILGPPGTGKTTTLIRRLGQKLEPIHLEDGEKEVVKTIAEAQGIPHANSWLMFTPTELLKRYLQEAFNRENIPAPERQLKTWHDYSRELGRNTFGVLRTATGGGPFVLKNELLNLKDKAKNNPIEWFEDFNAWQRKAYSQELLDAVSQLTASEQPEAKKLGERLKELLTQNESSPVSLFTVLAAEIQKVQMLVTGMKEKSDEKLKGALNLQLNRNRNFLDDLARFIDSLQQTQTVEADVDELEEQEVEEDEDSGLPNTARSVAMKSYMQAARAQARAAAGKRLPSKASRTGKIIEWLGDRGLAEESRAPVGTSLMIQAAARRFANPVKSYIHDIPKRYRSFRREQQQAGKWYISEGFEARDLHPLELDLVLLGILRSASELTHRTNIQRDINLPAWSALQAISGLYRNQILVDEATDFSPIQLACMASLAHPRLRSFFACGDFNQRLTSWGTRSEIEMKWVFGDFDIKEVSITYRQSQQLNQLARSIIQATGGTKQKGHLPEHMDSNGMLPVLLEQPKEGAVVPWIAERIREIERSIKQLPSIAVFVNSEGDVESLAEALGIALANDNIQVVACHEGQTIGQENDVRVFDIQHIKGLEFEAVFFVGIDQLAKLHPALFDKYLYVGATRAATYLGVTCEGTLPHAIESLREHFGQDWRQN